MLTHTYYAQNYANIIYLPLFLWLSDNDGHDHVSWTTCSTAAVHYTVVLRGHVYSPNYVACTYILRSKMGSNFQFKQKGIILIMHDSLLLSLALYS